jgi:putative pyoverdin transport system ATP-binding/permease protein
MKLPLPILKVGAGRILSIAALGVATGFASTGFIAIINRVLYNNGATPRHLLIMLFIVLAIARVTTNLWAQWIMVRFAQDKLLGMCEELSLRVVQTPFRILERIGPARILSTLTSDVATLAAALRAIPSVAGSCAVLVGCLVYLAYLSWIASLSMLTVTIIGALCYSLLLKKAYKAIRDARDGRDTLVKHFRSLTEGIKELKMNEDRQNMVIEEGIIEAASYLRKQNLVATLDYLKADGWAQIMFYLVIGLLLFALPAFKEISMETLTGYALVALYAMAPVWGIIATIPTFQSGEAALERIEALGFSLFADVQASSQSEERPYPVSQYRATAAAAPHIELNAVKFSYRAKDDSQENFVLGPVNLVLPPGKLIFLIGGNGSGKTTLLKLLAGLYPPDEGEVRVEGKVVPHDSQAYRHLFSVVFSDFYLFDRVQTSDGQNPDDRARKYLELLQLDHKVSIQNGVFSTIALSQGQRRRLALLSAYLEDRPVYIFDEWAADQDPAYKEVFYKHLLAELKSRGKTVIVITHDDRYFKLGDVIIKLDFGNIVDCWYPKKREEDTAYPAGISSVAGDMR